MIGRRRPSLAARVSHNVGQKYDPPTTCSWYAMGPERAGIGTASVIAGYHIATLAK